MHLLHHAILETPLPKGEKLRSGLLTFSEVSRSGGHSLVSITLGDELLPGYAIKAKKFYPGLDRRLVPVTQLPKLTGSPKAQGPQALLSSIVVRRMRECAADMCRHGGALIDAQTWDQMAADAGLSRRGKYTVRSIVDYWAVDCDHGPAYLKRVGKDRWTLGDEYAAERSFIEQAGVTSLQQRENGKRGHRSRRRKRGG